MIEQVTPTRNSDSPSALSSCALCMYACDCWCVSCCRYVPVAQAEADALERVIGVACFMFVGMKGSEDIVKALSE